MQLRGTIPPGYQSQEPKGRLLCGLCGLACCGEAAAVGCSMLVAGVISLPMVGHAQPSCKDKQGSQQRIPSDTNKSERNLKNGTCQQGISKVMTLTSVSVPRGNPKLFLPPLQLFQDW